MTTSNTPDQRIDDLLNELTSAIWLQAQMAILDKHESYGNKAESREQAKAALKSLFETMANDVIGIPNYETYEQTVIAQFQDEQRQRIPQVIAKYFGENDER